MKPTRENEAPNTSRGVGTEDASIEDTDPNRSGASRMDQPRYVPSRSSHIRIESQHTGNAHGPAGIVPLDSQQNSNDNLYGISEENKSTLQKELPRTSFCSRQEDPIITINNFKVTLKKNSVNRIWNFTQFSQHIVKCGSTDEEQGTSRALSRTPIETSSISQYTLEREVKKYVTKRESTSYQHYPGTETLDYDYVEERTDMYSTNLVESTAHLIKGSLGAGVLSMHEAYMYGGLWTSLAFTYVVGFLVSYTMLMLAKSAQLMYGKIRMSKLSYPDLAEVAAATGPWIWFRKHSKAFRYLVDLCLFVKMCGTCCVYQIMIAHTLKQVIEGISADVADRLVNIRLYILIVTPALLLLCMIRSLKFLAPFSMLADIFVAMCVLTTLYYSLRTADNISERPAWKDLHGFIRFLGICLYCTSGVAVALPVENNMRKPGYFRVAVQYAMTIVVLFISTTGFFGYWGWGEDCRSPITVHMPLNTFTTILQFLLVMMLSTTFAVQFWVPFRIIWHYIIRKYKRKQALWERFYRLIMATLVSGMSIAFPNLIPVMIFIGQFFLGFIAFVFPAIIDHLVMFGSGSEEERKTWRIIQNTFLILLGLLLSLSSFYSIRQIN